jgi:EAL domain-containing protein (putative c-di-GMP-specific phosphodiesterase class I)/CheY-like chemotaxis protein
MTRPCIAILDDDAALGNFIAAVAGKAGYRAFTGHDGSALAGLLAEKPEIMVLDLEMADVDGIEVIRQLAESRFPGRLIIASGHSQGMLKAAKMLAEMQGLKVMAALTKPIRSDALLALLGQAQVAAAPKSAAPVTIEDLARGVAADELEIHYQPQARMSDGAWVGLEALVRWRHPVMGLLPPSAFIGLAEQSNQALPLTVKVMETALKDCVWLGEAADYRGSLSINLPPAAMVDLKFPEQVLAAMTRLHCDRNLLQFEITETSVPPNPATALDILARLRLKGFNLSIDDFGTGHSSLEQLQQLPFAELKIDLGFVMAAKADHKSRVIVESSITLGRQLGLSVLAEGVEDEGCWNWLRASGCELAQGYFISKPLPIDQIIPWSQGWAKQRDGLFDFTPPRFAAARPRPLTIVARTGS